MMQNGVIVLHAPCCSRGDDDRCVFDDPYPCRGLSYFHGRDHGPYLVLYPLPSSCRHIRVRKIVDLQGNPVYLFSVLRLVLDFLSSGWYHGGGRDVRADLLASVGGYHRRIHV